MEDLASSHLACQFATHVDHPCNGLVAFGCSMDRNPDLQVFDAAGSMMRIICVMGLSALWSVVLWRRVTVLMLGRLRCALLGMEPTLRSSEAGTCEQWNCAREQYRGNEPEFSQFHCFHPSGMHPRGGKRIQPSHGRRLPLLHSSNFQFIAYLRSRTINCVRREL